MTRTKKILAVVALVAIPAAAWAADRFCPPWCPPEACCPTACCEAPGTAP